MSSKTEPVTAEDYDKNTEIELKDDEAIYRYLCAVHTFIWADGPFPAIDRDNYA
ncbi:hypothetical protein QCN27_16855 [Cereibacter sp. SYSU M97828]|nr:hypothetical protein [Cereibacter flavus]